MANPEESNQPQQSSKSNKLLLIVIPLLTLCIGVLTGLYLFGAFSDQSEASAEEPVAPEEEVTEVIQLPPLVIHLADSSGLHYLRVGLSFGVFNPEVGGALMEEQFFMPKLKDYLLSAIGQKTALEIASPAGRESLKQEILEGANQLLPPAAGAEILEVYVTEFIVQ